MFKNVNRHYLFLNNYSFFKNLSKLDRTKQSKDMYIRIDRDIYNC